TIFVMVSIPFVQRDAATCAARNLNFLDYVPVYERKPKLRGALGERRRIFAVLRLYIRLKFPVTAGPGGAAALAACALAKRPKSATARAIKSPKPASRTAISRYIPRRGRR